MEMVVVVVMMISFEPISSAAAPQLYISNLPLHPGAPSLTFLTTQRMMSRSSTEEPTMLLAAVIRLR